MLYDPDRPKISEAAQNQIEETRIEKITALTVTKFGTGQFAQCRREIAPGIGIGNWIEREFKALPNRPGKNERKQSPIKQPPKRIFPQPKRLIACERRDHFQDSANVGRNRLNHKNTS